MRKRDRKSSTVTQQELARVLGLSPRQIRNLEAQGMPTQSDGTGKEYPVPAAVAWYYERKFASETPSEREARARKTTLQADKLEMELAIQRGDYMALDDAEAEIRRFAEDVNGALINAPARHAPTLAAKAKMKIPTATRILQELVEDVRKDLRDLASKTA